MTHCDIFGTEQSTPDYISNIQIEGKKIPRNSSVCFMFHFLVLHVM